MKKNRYGNIEDIVLDISAVTARGKLERSCVGPRESIGIGDARRWMFGSEGSLGIVTQALVKIFPLPEVQRYGSVLFPDFDSGVHFLKELAQHATPPASARLVDNLQFKFGQMLKGRKRGAQKLISALQRIWVTKVKRFDPDRMTALTLLFEGNRQEVRSQQNDLYRIAARHGGMKAGAENGFRGYQLTFGIAYIRDWIMNHFMLGESFETSVSWSQVLTLCENVKRRVRAEHTARGLPGKPFITCRVTQVYPTGVCVYFYLAYYFKDVDNPSGVFAEIESAARDEVLKSGGSLSHHHGIGKLRRGYLSKIHSAGILAWSRELKQATDPTNVFGAGNQNFTDSQNPPTVEPH
jgi:alkyldihydroxyacetonephosphate synthase